MDNTVRHSTGWSDPRLPQGIDSVATYYRHSSSRSLLYGSYYSSTISGKTQEL
jgi:hypothetical protein